MTNWQEFIIMIYHNDPLEGYHKDVLEADQNFVKDASEKSTTI